VAGLALAGFAVAAGVASPPEAAAPSLAPAPSRTLSGAGTIPTGLPTTAQLAAAGIQNPISMEREGGRIEIRHRDAQNRRVETYLDAATGAVVKQEVEDGHGERDDD
jgi:hypothetical protein